MNDYDIVFIKKEYFIDNPYLIEILDQIDTDKQAHRNYVFLSLKYEDNNILVPLRSNIKPFQRYGIIGYPVLSNKKPNAGLDFRKILIINNIEYIEFVNHLKIPLKQQNILSENFKEISDLIFTYIRGYRKAIFKNRIKYEKRYKYCTLQNFHYELNIDQSQQEVAATKIE